MRTPINAGDAGDAEGTEMKKLAVSVIALSALWVGSAQAQVDQRNTVGELSENQFNGERLGQSFRPTLSGLNFITLNLNGATANSNVPLSVSVFQGAGFSGTNIGTSRVTNVLGQTNQSYTFSFANLISLTPNNTYTFALSTSAQTVGFRYSATDPYTRGDLYFGSGGSFPANPGLDLQFSEGIAAAPEPGSWALLIAGFGIVGYALRTRRRRISYGNLTARTTNALTLT